MLKSFIAITTVVGALITAPNAIESQVGQGFKKPLVKTEFVSRKDDQVKPRVWVKGKGAPTGIPQPRRELEVVLKTKDSSERSSRFLIEPKTNNDRGIELELTDEMKQNIEFFNGRRFKLSQPSNQ